LKGSTIYRVEVGFCSYVCMNYMYYYHCMQIEQKGAELLEGFWGLCNLAFIVVQKPSQLKA